VAAVAETCTWQSTLAPLIEFCRVGTRAADAEIVDRHREELRMAPYLGSGGALTRNLSFARTRYREGGTGEVIRRGGAKARRLMGFRSD
jgi:hypothetical protein